MNSSKLSTLFMSVMILATFIGLLQIGQRTDNLRHNVESAIIK